MQTYKIVRHNTHTDKYVPISKKVYDNYDNAVNALIKRVYDKKLNKLLPSNFDDLSMTFKHDNCADLLGIFVMPTEG